ncbi:unnamed protein product [Ilex paraguariensis]|uniref:Uncharacterized protein n=1 Tax=Ilex paraguariensis TaxID=185542 RepID=A0ABC8UQV9_9AQUA
MSHLVMLGQNSEDAPMDLRKSATFIPRNKGSDDASVNSCHMVKQIRKDGSEQFLKQTDFPVRIAARVAQQSEGGAMQEDKPEMNMADRTGGCQKPSRHYRNRSRFEGSVS